MAGLFIDIELSPAIACVFGLYDQNIPYHSIIQEQFIISVAWQWTEEEEVHSVCVADDKKRFKKNPTDDFAVVKKICSLIEQADFVIAHNLVQFDWKKILSRVIFHKLPPLKQVVMVDTLKQARKAGFLSRKLDDLGTLLQLGNKLETERGLWVKAACGNEEAIRAIETYNRGDILPLRELYFRLRPYMPDGFNRNNYSNSGCCPACGSKDFIKKGYAYNKATMAQRYKCSDCGHRFTDGKQIKKNIMR